MRRPSRRTLRMVAMVVPVVLVVAAVAAVWSARGGREEGPSGQTTLERLDVYGQLPRFSLTERSGRRIGLEDLRGFVWVADFIYTECKETCPTQSLEISRLQAELAGSADLRLVSITVDPKHDTPEVLRRYAERYGATDRWLFLTGDKREIYCLAKQGFRLAVEDPAASEPIECGAAFRLGPRPAWASHGSGGLIMHSARLVLVDRAVRIRAYHLATDRESMKRLRTNVRRLLAERAKP